MISLVASHSTARSELRYRRKFRRSGLPSWPRWLRNPRPPAPHRLDKQRADRRKADGQGGDVGPVGAARVAVRISFGAIFCFREAANLQRPPQFLERTIAQTAGRPAESGHCVGTEAAYAVAFLDLRMEIEPDRTIEARSCKQGTWRERRETQIPRLRVWLRSRRQITLFIGRYTNQFLTEGLRETHRGIG